MLLRAVCAGVVVGILTAGLWPFHAPKNDVSWVSGGTGLYFGKHGSIVSASPLGAKDSQAQPCTLEVWLGAKRFDSRGGGTVLAFYRPESGITSFALRQWRGGLVLERDKRSRAGSSASIYVADVFRRQKPVLFSLSSSEAGTAVYLDGVLVRRAADFAISNQDLSGELVIGNSPITTYNWSGQVKGIAIYERELSAPEVAHDLTEWTAGGATPTPADLAKSGVVARYAFDEGKGNVVRNQVDAATNLRIPERFFILREQFLERPWDEYHPTWHYLKDVFINIAGFIPLGFFFRAYFQATGRSTRATWFTIALGFATSLTIEVLQAFLPTRDSGMTDLMTNTLGTALGAILFVYIRKHEWLERAGVFPEVLQESAK